MATLSVLLYDIHFLHKAEAEQKQEMALVYRRLEDQLYALDKTIHKSSVKNATHVSFISVKSF